MSKKTFLKKLAQEVIAQHGTSFEDISLVFPNRRAGLFFRKCLAESLDTPIWSPSVLSMEDFVQQHTTLQIVDKFNAIVELYKVYCKYLGGDELFDNFFYWGEMLLGDFDDIDKYLIDTRILFTDLSKQKELDDYFDYLTPEQRKIILEFWGSFSESTSEEKRNFQLIWSKLNSIYTEFTNQLIQKNLSYTGLMYRQVAQSLPEIDKKKHVIFAGFNALTTSEEKIITHYIREGVATIRWDVDAYYMENQHQEAGVFLREYKSKTVFEKSLAPPYPKAITGHSSPIHLHAVAQQAGQIKYLGFLLDQMIKAGEIKPETTAIILPDESLLFPVLNVLPQSIEKVNITMGFPLTSTTVFSFLSHFLEMQLQARKTVKDTNFYFVHVIRVLKNPLVTKKLGTDVESVCDTIEKNNWVRVSKSQLGLENELINSLFKPAGDVDELILILQDAIAALAADEGEVLDQEYAYHFYTQLNRIKEVIKQFKLNLSLEAFVRLFKQMVQSLRLPFTGEPLQGIQIMGVLETRNLDFDSVFILSMNEGSFPAPGKGHSFVPYNLRKAYGLPTFDQQDAIYAYLFYRLLHQAEQVHLFYNTEEGPTGGGELSRYVQQLKQEKPRELVEDTFSLPLLMEEPQEICIEKNEKILAKLDEYTTANDSNKQFTPSAINTYLDCRLRFYFKYVAEIYEREEIQDQIDLPVFGNILHQAMEKIYSSFDKEHIISVDDLKNLESSIATYALESFQEHFNKADLELEGTALLAFEVVKKYMKQVLKTDQHYAPFNIIGLEAREYTYELRIEGEENVKTIRLKGIIDRIDKKGERVRVIDYKTGKDKRDMNSIISLLDREDSKRNKAAMQTFMYALLYSKNVPTCNVLIPGIVNTKEIFLKNFDYHILLDKEPIVNVKPMLPEFEGYLQDLLSEIYSSHVPFSQTDNTEKCNYCPYTSICNR